MALDNSLVLSTVFSYIPFEDIKKVRLVNHLWRMEADNFFKKRSLVTFAFERMCDNECEEFLKTSRCHANFAISLWCRDNQLISSTIRFKDKMNIFVQTQGSQIRSLELMIGSSNNITTDFEFLSSVFVFVPTLEELILQIDFEKDAANIDDWIKTLSTIKPLIFVKRVKLALFPCSRQDAFDNERFKLKKLLTKVISLTPNLESLKLPVGYSANYCKILLDEMRKLQEKWGADVKNTISIPFAHLSSILTDSSRLDQLLLLCQSMANISITMFCIDPKEELDKLSKLVAKHSATLVSIKLKYHVSCIEDSDDDDDVEDDGEGQNQGESVITMIDKFPNLPALQSLDFHVKGRIEDLPKGGKDTGLFDFFKLEKRQFQEKFPSLRAFIWKDSFNVFNPTSYERVLSRPKQGEGSEFPQFTVLDLSGKYPNREIYCSKLTYENWMIWLAKTFPNVHNPQFVKARITGN